MGSQLQPVITDVWADKMFDNKGNIIIDEVRDYAKATYNDPVTAAAFVATVKAEAGAGTVESADYSRTAALKDADNGLTFTKADGKTKYTRKDLVKAVYDNPLYQAKKKDGTPDINRLNKAGQKAFFDIYYNDAYRGEDYKMGNTSSDDGYKYRGRGLIQVTGKDNYKKLGESLGVDLVANPELLDTDKNLMLRATNLYLENKNFTGGLTTPDLTSDRLRRIIGHNNTKGKGETLTPAEKRWNNAKEHYTAMYGGDMPNSSTQNLAPLDSSPRPQMRPVPSLNPVQADSASILSAVTEANKEVPPMPSNPQKNNAVEFTQPVPQPQQPIIKEEVRMKYPQYLADGTEEVIPPYILDARRPRVASQIPTPPTMQDFSLPTVVAEAPVPPVQTVFSEPMARPSGGFGSNIEYTYYTFLDEIGYNDTPVAREMFKRYQDKMNARSMQDGFNTNPKIFGDNAISFSNNPEQLAVPSMGENYSIAGEQPVALNKQGPYPINPMSTGGGFNPQTRPSFDSARMMEINNPMGESIGANAVGSGPAVPAMQPQVTGPFANVPRNYGNGLEAAQSQAIENGYVPEVVNSPMTDPRNLGGSEGYGSLGSVPQVQNPYDFNPYGNNPMGEIPLIENVDSYSNEELRVLANTDNAAGSPWAEALQERTQREENELRANLQRRADAGIVPTEEQLNQLSDMELQSRNASEVAAANREVVIANEQTVKTAEEALGATERARKAELARRAAEQGIVLGGVPPVVEDSSDEPEAPVKTEDSKTEDLGSTNGAGLSTNKKGEVVGPDGVVIKELTPAQAEAEANNAGSSIGDLLGKLGPIFKSLFGLETQDMTRALGFYLMSRASGASHEGSMRWAGGTVLKQAEARNIRDSSRADAAAKAFTAVSGNYTKEAASKIRSALAKGNIVEAQALMDDANSKTTRGKLGIDPNATGTFYMMPGYTKSVEVFEGTGGNRYTKITTTEDGKTVEKYIPISSQQMGELRERGAQDDDQSRISAVRAYVEQMPPALFQRKGVNDKGETYREAGIFSGRNQEGVTADIMAFSKKQRELGLRDDPLQLMMMVGRGAELAEAMGVTKINAETILNMQIVGGDILFDQGKISKDGELAPASKIKSFTTDFQDILGNDRKLIKTTMDTAAKTFNPEMTIDSIKTTDNYNKLSPEQKLNIDSAPSAFMALALLTAYENKPNK